jgi:putative cytoplasmic protein
MQKIDTKRLIKICKEVVMQLEKDKLYISFHRPKSIVGLLITLRTLGKYSHCELVYNDYVYLSNPGGVRIKPFIYKNNMDIYELDSHIEIPIVLEEFKKLKGKGYDYGAILFSQLLELGIEHKDKYFCSELCLHLINKGLDDSLTYNLMALKASAFSPSKLFKYLKNMELIK